MTTDQGWVYLLSRLMIRFKGSTVRSRVLCCITGFQPEQWLIMWALQAYSQVDRSSITLYRQSGTLYGNVWQSIATLPLCLSSVRSLTACSFSFLTTILCCNQNLLGVKYRKLKALQPYRVPWHSNDWCPNKLWHVYMYGIFLHLPRASRLCDQKVYCLFLVHA